MSDLRNALKAAHLKRKPVIFKTKPINNVQLKAQYIESLKEACIKTVRTNIVQYITKEEQVVIEEDSISSLKPHRKKLALKIFEHMKKRNNNVQYITGKDSQGIKNEILKHLNYMLPNNGDYAEILKQREGLDLEAAGSKLSNAVTIASGVTPILSVEAASESIAQLTRQAKLTTSVIMRGQSSGKDNRDNNDKKIATVETTDCISDKPNNNPAEVLAAMSDGQAVQNFRRLSRNEGEAMLANIALAMDLNHQQDLNEVADLMRAKGIDLDMLADFLSSSLKMAS